MVQQSRKPLAVEALPVAVPPFEPEKSALDQFADELTKIIGWA